MYSFMVVPREQGLPFVGPCPSCTSIIDGIDGALPHITQRISFVVASKRTDQPVPRARREARLATRPPSVLGFEQLQPRLRRGGLERQPMAAGHGVRPARRRDPPLLEQRALVRPARRRPGSPRHVDFYSASGGDVIDDLRPARPKVGARTGTWAAKLDCGGACGRSWSASTPTERLPGRRWRQVQ